MSAAQGPLASRYGGLAPVPVRAADPPLLPAWLARPMAAGRVRPGVPRQRRSRGAIAHPDGAIDWIGTLSRSLRPAPADVRRRVRRLAIAGSSVFALDCSASMLDSGALRHAKGLVRALAARASRDRAPLALVSFGGRDARLELASPRANGAFDSTVSSLLAGGGTPLRRALELSLELCRATPPAATRPRLLVFTDGRTRDPIADLAPACRGIDLVVIDCERGRVRLGRARRLAITLGGQLAHIDALSRVERPALPGAGAPGSACP